MSNHTKLEWKRAANADFKHEIYTADPLNPNSTRLICQVAKFKDPHSQPPRRFGDPESPAQQLLTQEWQDNSNLILAAPKLLTALENLVKNVAVPEDPKSDLAKVLKKAQELVDSFK